MLRIKRKGQSTLEYIIVLTAIVAIILTAVYTTIGNKASTAGLGKLMYKAGESVTAASGKAAAIIK